MVLDGFAAECRQTNMIQMGKWDESRGRKYPGNDEEGRARRRRNWRRLKWMLKESSSFVVGWQQKL